MNINQLAEALKQMWFDVELGTSRTMDAPDPDDVLDSLGTTASSLMRKPVKWWEEVEISLIAWLCIEGEEGIAGEVVVYGTGHSAALIVDRKQDRCCRIEGAETYEILIVDRRHKRCAKIAGVKAIEAAAKKAEVWFGK